MARKRLKNGRFAKTSRSSRKRATARRPRARKNPPRRKRRASTPRKRGTTVATRRAPARRRRRAPARRNPDVVKMLTKGVGDAAYLLGGEAVTRSLPRLLRLPATGTTGMLAQAGTAVAVGFAADRFLGREQGAMVLAGALAVPIRDAVVRMGVPVIGPALTPTPLGAGAYRARMAGGDYSRRAVGSGSYAARAGMAGGEYAPGHLPLFRNGAGASTA